jgi:1-acyl-sn-glycerol-3-phosphate acyltransferase
LHESNYLFVLKVKPFFVAAPHEPSTTTMAEDKKSNDITVLDTDPAATTALEHFFGALAVSTFITVWIASCASPILLFLSLKNGNHIISTLIILSTVIAYAPWEHGPFSRAFQSFLNRYHALYYNGVSIVFEGGDVPAKSASHGQTFFAVHPHGAFCIGWALLYHNPAMRRVRFCFASTLFASPFFRIFSRAANCPGSAARPSMDAYLRRGEDVALPPGGFEEATLTSTKVDRVFIKRRYGFVRLCLKYGVAIRPVYVFGEGKLFNNVQGLWSTRLSWNRCGIPTIITWGRLLFPLLPKNWVKLHIVVGRPLKLPKIENPTKDEVTVWHEKYINELKRIYDEHKVAAYGSEEGKVAKLEVW